MWGLEERKRLAVGRWMIPGCYDDGEARLPLHPQGDMTTLWQPGANCDGTEKIRNQVELWRLGVPIKRPSSCALSDVPSMATRHNLCLLLYPPQQYHRCRSSKVRVSGSPTRVDHSNARLWRKGTNTDDEAWKICAVNSISRSR